ncbi:MAG: GNAT family N-acetyltransferase [Gammaproteobacteria bacterium]
MVPDVEFRTGNEADALCVGALAIQVFLDTYAKEGIRPDLAREALANYSPQAFSQRLADHNTTIVVAEKDGFVFAFGEVTRNRPCPVVDVVDTVELVRLYVQPTSQRHGLGRALLGQAEKLAIEAGAGSLWLTAWTGNAQALAFYRAHGYKSAGTTSHVFEAQTYENQVLIKTPLRRAS